jgi:hypothetical protein
VNSKKTPLLAFMYICKTKNFLAEDTSIVFFLWFPGIFPWMKELLDNTSSGGPTYAAQSKPQYNSAFATRVLQSAYVYVKGRESLSPNFKTFQDPMHQFHKIGILFSGTLYIIAIPALLHMQAELIPWKFLHFLFRTLTTEQSTSSKCKIILLTKQSVRWVEVRW